MILPKPLCIEGVLPDRESPHGKAWRFNCAALRRKHNIADKADATIASWIVEARWAHPFWWNYWLSIIHLRPTTQLPNPKINLTGATHELWCFALDPQEVPSLECPARLEPANFIGQLILGGDLEAEMLLEKTVEDIVAGKLNPDTDARREWVRRFGDSNIKKP